MREFLRRFSWRHYQLKRHALADADWQHACAHLPLVTAMPDAAQQQLRELSTLFLAQKAVLPADGFALSTAQQIEIAIWACLPVRQIGLAVYASFHAVIVYPDEFLAPREEIDEAGVVHTGHEQVSGESWDAGPILLSWADVEAARIPDGYNVVIHECVHKLDLTDGDMNGVPTLLGRGIAPSEWQQVMRAAWQTVGQEEKLLGYTSVDDYALESPAEFFAVLSEHFFTAPAELQADLPAAYALLERYYDQRPLDWNWAAIDAAYPKHEPDDSGYRRSGAEH
ncbi:zinc-dependent peptidase [Permianibacter sp. IMCC34836]|uniref:M90 family metallopeptidase n=1 Tax=Permianibacter fluminis TaxID=2738515 RepID=UPI001552E0AC|nr:M90 family metallopeptidase [Permianibacter fluminis]NQD35733.1 zinc-dependent peptidase [Permianibacter fluminis]